LTRLEPLRELFYLFSQQPDVSCVAVLAAGFAAFFAAYVYKRPGDRPWIFRPMVVICSAGALYYWYVLIADQSTTGAAALETQLLDVFVILLYILICWRTCKSIGLTTPVMHKALYSSVLVLPSVYALTLLSAWSFPPPDLAIQVERSMEFPASYFLTRLHLIALVFYAALLAVTFHKQVKEPMVLLRKRKVQMALWEGGSVCLILIPLNTGVRNTLQILAGPLDPDVVTAQIWVQMTLVITGGILFLAGLTRQSSKTSRDKALELVLRWTETRHEIEKQLFRLVYKSPGVDLFERYLTKSAQLLWVTSAEDSDTSQDAALTAPLSEEATKAALTYKLAVAVAMSQRTKVLAHTLRGLQTEIAKDDSLGCSLLVGVTDEDVRPLREDILLPCIKPAIELGTSHNHAPNYLKQDEWKQLAAVTFANYATETGLLPDRSLRRILSTAVAGYISGTYQDVRDYAGDARLRGD